jgi:hypothetical protein
MSKGSPLIRSECRLRDRDRSGKARCQRALKIVASKVFHQFVPRFAVVSDRIST